MKAARPQLFGGRDRFLIRNWSVPVAGAVVLPRLEAVAVPAASPEPPAPPPRAVELNGLP